MTGPHRAEAPRAPARSAPLTRTPRLARTTWQVSVTDKDGGTGSDQAAVTVQAAPPPNQAPTARPGGPYAADATVAFNGAASSDPDNNLRSPTRGPSATARRAAGQRPATRTPRRGATTVTLIVTESLGLAAHRRDERHDRQRRAGGQRSARTRGVVLGCRSNLSATFTDPGGATDAPWAWTIAWGERRNAAGSTSVLGGPITAMSHVRVRPVRTPCKFTGHR